MIAGRIGLGRRLAHRLEHRQLVPRNLAQKSRLAAQAYIVGWTIGVLALGSPGRAQSNAAESTPAALSGATANLIVPELPSLREFERYSPQDRTINLLLKLGHRKVYVFEGQKLVASFPVAIGRSDFPTPTGEFKVFEMIVNPSWKNPWTGEVETPGPDGSLGLRWIGFTELSNGVIGFHGTPNVASIGQAASHGCVRMRNEDIVKLYELVRIGTLVRVEP